MRKQSKQHITITNAWLLSCALIALLLSIHAAHGTASEPVQSSPPDESGKTLVLAAVGDIMMPGSLQKAMAKHNDDYSLLFEHIAPSLGVADLAFANLETPVDHTRAVSGYPEFNSRTELLKALKGAGMDVLSIANNHMLDAGDAGLKRTIVNIRSAGLTPVGAGATREEALEPVFMMAQGFRVAFLAYTYGTNGGPPRKKKPRAYVNVFESSSDKDVDSLKTLLGSIRAKADIIVLSLHWGEEYSAKPAKWQRRAAAELIEAGVDILLGHHPHVLQPIERHIAKNGRKGLVAYSLGNFISSQNFGVSHRNKNIDRAFRGDGVILKISMKKENDGVMDISGYEIQPLWTYRESVGGVILARPVSVIHEIERLSEKQRSKAEENMLKLLDYRREMILQRTVSGGK